MDEIRPVLIITSTVFLIPISHAYTTGFYKDHMYIFISYIYIFLTSILFHTTRLKVFMILDKIGIANHVVIGLICTHQQSTKEIIVYWTTISYAIISYIIGYQYSIFAFDSDFYIQQFFHGLNHFFISYISIVINQYSKKRIS